MFVQWKKTAPTWVNLDKQSSVAGNIRAFRSFRQSLLLTVLNIPSMGSRML